MASRVDTATPVPALSPRQRKRLVDLATYLLLTLVAITMVFPFVWMVVTSLKSYRELFVWPPQLFPGSPQWGNYLDAWSYSASAPFGRFFLNSFVVSVCVTLGQLVTCSMAGYAFARLHFPGRNVLFLAYLATLMVPSQVTLVPLYLIMRRLDWVDTHYALIVPGLVSAYGTFLVRQFMLTLPRDLEDAARLDGANPPTIFLQIVLPLSKPVLTTLTILTFLSSWNAFLWPLIMISDTSRRTLPIGLAFFTSVPETVGFPQFQLLMAAATFAMLPTLIVFLVAQRYFVKGIAMTGLKG